MVSCKDQEIALVNEDAVLNDDAVRSVRVAKAPYAIREVPNIKREVLEQSI